MTTCSATLMVLRVRDLGDRDPALDGGLEVDVVRPDAGSDGELEFLALAIRSAVR